jgi:soluble lytic murein transglycosylase-like protein
MTSSDISALILSTATAYGVDPRLALEVAMQESGLDQSAVSSAGAIGIFQLMPATAADLGVDPTDPTQNIQGGVKYLSEMLSRYGNNVAEALGAYNWGPGNMDKAIAAHGAGWMNYAPLETQDYVQTIVSNIQSQYTVALNSAPLPGATAADGTPVDEASVLPTGWSFGTALWIGAAVVAGWIVFSLLE